MLLHSAIDKLKNHKKSCITLLTDKLRNATLALESEVMDLINTGKVKGRLAELGLTQKDVAIALEIAQPTANQKINNIRPMDLNEAEKLAGLLHLEPNDFQLYFFAR